MNCPKCEHEWYPTPSELAAELGRIKSEEKARAARENGKKGGRPKGAMQWYLSLSCEEKRLALVDVAKANPKCVTAKGVNIVVAWEHWKKKKAAQS